MIGAVIGDIVGSRFEFHNHKSKEFPLFAANSHFTDDTVMTAAIALAVMDHKEHNRPLDEAAVYWMRKVGQPYKRQDTAADLETGCTAMTRSLTIAGVMVPLCVCLPVLGRQSLCRKLCL